MVTPLVAAAVLAVTPSADRTLVAAGDIACRAGQRETASQCRQARTAAVTRAQRPDAIALLGDLQYDRGTLAEFRGGFDRSWGSLPNLRPAPGNHEYSTPGAAGYYDYLGTRAGPGRRGYYSYDLGAWHIVSLNSNCAAVSCAAGSAQERWLRADLARNTARCTLAYWHHPRFSSGLHGASPRTAALLSALVRDRADVVLAGHDHSYERFAPRDGIRHFTSGGGGRVLYGFRRSMAGSERRLVRFGVLALTLRPTGYAWRFLSDRGATLDRGVSDCV